MSHTNKRKTPFCPRCKAVRRIVTRRAKPERGQAATWEFVCESAECKAWRKKRSAEAKVRNEKAREGRLQEVAAWAAEHFEERTIAVAENRARIDEVNPDTRVSWSETRARLGKGTAEDRVGFQKLYEQALTRRGLLGVLRGSESAGVWWDRKKAAVLGAAAREHLESEDRHMDLRP